MGMCEVNWVLMRYGGMGIKRVNVTNRKLRDEVIAVVYEED